MKNKMMVSTLVLGLTFSLGTQSYAASAQLNFSALDAIISQKNHLDLSSDPAQELPSGVFTRLNSVKSQKNIGNYSTSSSQSEKLGLDKIVDHKLTIDYNR